MPRDLHKKSSKATSKRSARKNSTTDNSSDEDYDAVDLISDSDGDEPDVEDLEEQAIIESEEEEEIFEHAAPSETDEDDDMWHGVDNTVIDLTRGSQASAADGDSVNAYFEEQMSRSGEAAMMSIIRDAPAKRVRFETSDESSEDSEDTVNAMFPDLINNAFYFRHELGPLQQRAIHVDSDMSDDHWAEDDEADSLSEVQPEGEDAVSSAGSSSGYESGYETDEGETTEEDLPPAARFVKARTVLRRQSPEPASDEEVVARRNSNAREGPRLGTWVHTPERAFAIMDNGNRKLIMYKAKIKRRYSFDNAARVPQLFSESNFQLPQDMSPMISNSANIMMSAMHDSLDGFPREHQLWGANHISGPPEAFYTSSNLNIADYLRDSMSPGDEDDTDNDYEEDIDLFLNLDGESSDEGGNASDNEGDMALPASQTTPREDPAQPKFFSTPGLAGAFRRNQDQHKVLTSGNATKDSVNFSSSFGDTAYRGIKPGRMQAAGAPMTPMRKHRAAALDSSPAISAMKRKFSGEQRGHKRSRSAV